MRTLISGLALIVLLYAALALYASHIKRSGMFFPDRYPAGDWSPRLPVTPRDLYFTTPDGVKLHAWLFPASDPDGPVMIWFHGNAGHLAYRGPTAAEFAARGMTVFVFDYRGFGRSDGRPTEAALHVDSLAAYDFVRQSLRPSERRIVLYGESVGAPYAARVAMQRPSCCIIVENSFPSLARLGNALYRPIPMGWFGRGVLQTGRWLNAAGVPVLVMHGKRDRVVPFSLGVELFNDLKVEKKFFQSEAAGHCEIEAVEGDRYYQTIFDFVRQHLPTRG